jgi:hypothetical protein
MVVAKLERPPVAKKRTGRPKSENPRGEGLQVRLAPDVVRMAKVVNPVKGVSLTDYLSGILRPIVTRDYAQTQKMFETEGGGK